MQLQAQNHTREGIEHYSSPKSMYKKWVYHIYIYIYIYKQSGVGLGYPPCQSRPQSVSYTGRAIGLDAGLSVGGWITLKGPTCPVTEATVRAQNQGVLEPQELLEISLLSLRIPIGDVGRSEEAIDKENFVDSICTIAIGCAYFGGN